MFDTIGVAFLIERISSTAGLTFPGSRDATGKGFSVASQLGLHFGWHFLTHTILRVTDTELANQLAIA